MNSAGFIWRRSA